MRFDDLVVGAGSAGAIVAARLSEEPARRVCLLEAGPHYGSAEATPADLLDSRDLGGPAHDWGYVAEPVSGRSMPYRRGKVTGGTSATNAAAAHWPDRDDLAEWPAEWTWESVVPYLRRLPMPLAQYAEPDWIPLQRAFYAACRAAGFAHMPDHNAGVRGGVGAWSMNRAGTRRVSTALAYLHPAQRRANLAIRAGALVERVLFSHGRACGVRLASGETLEARRVILSAGVFGTPALLLRSGLDAPGIGRGLQDHPAVPIDLAPRRGECMPGRDPRLQVLARFSAPGSTVPDDMQLVMTSHAGDGRAVLRVALMKARSRGRVTLSSADPAAPPRIELNYLHDPEDVRRLLEGTRLAYDIVRSPALSAALAGIAAPDPATVESDERLLAYLRASVGTYCHAACTARMGADGDPGAVLDPHCRVRGVEALWVADASALPALPRTGPNFIVMALAERVAEILRGAA